MTNFLKVSLNQTDVGTLTLLPSGNVVFAIDEAYQNNPARPVLSQSFFRPSGELILESIASSAKVPPFFANLLPEGHMRDYLAQRGGIKATNEFKLIELLGQDLSGAVAVTPLEGTPVSYQETDILNIKSNLKPLRFSLAGVQLKFSAIASRSGGLTIPAKGVGGDWIVKLPAQNYAQVPENEYAIMDLASRVGIPIPQVSLVPLTDISNLPEMGLLAGQKALVVKRFDRGTKGMPRIHAEDFAQVFGVLPDKKYEGVSYGGIANMVWTLTGEAGLVDFIRRLTFCIVVGNGDMHLKNWSFVYLDGKTPSLAPAYDLLSTVPYIPQDGLALKLADTKNMQGVTLAHFKKLVKKAQVPEKLVLKTVQETVDATLNAWAENGAHYELPKAIKDSIQVHMDSLALRDE